MRMGKLGILGGMGPFASAEFVKTIYERTAFDLEQQAPDLLLHSICSVPDRTESILQSHDQLFIDHLRQNLEILAAEADRIVIACYTSHFAIPFLPVELQRKILSLIGICDRYLPANGKRYLLLATKGAYQKRVFQPLYDRVELLDSRDLEWIHQYIYTKLKYNRGIGLFPEIYFRLKKKYGVDGVIAGCTEFHLVSKQLDKDECCMFDPLDQLIESLFIRKTVYL